MTDLSGDPVFQLNTVLWMLQPMPQGSTAVNAVLHQHGYAVRSMGQTLTADPTLERVLATEFDLRGAPCPDVLASAPEGSPWPVFECKRSAFGVDSTTSAQAAKVLARSIDLSLTVGAAPEAAVGGCAVFVTRDSEAPALQATVDELAEGLQGIPTAPSSTVGLRVAPGEGVIARVVAGHFPGIGGAALAGDVVIVPAAGAEEEARPLYFVPFDPSVEQDEEERAACLRILLARGQAHAASTLGRGTAQGTAVLVGQELLDDATYGLARYWRDNATRDRAAQEILKFVKAALRDVRRPNTPMVTEGSGPKRLEVVIRSAEHRQECAEAVMAHPLPGDVALNAVIADELPFADADTAVTIDEQNGA